VCLAVGGEEPDGVGVPPTGAGFASGMFPHIRVSWSGWLRQPAPVSRVRGRRHPR
jgi:hypothetical protein